MENDREVLCIYVKLTESFRVDSERKSACMIAFTGKAEGSGFQGVIMPHGVDTQRISPDGTTELSARYMLEGVDSCGNPCHIFIENNGTLSPDRKSVTHPVVLTDSPDLRWLENAKLYGTLEGEEGSEFSIRIHIYSSAPDKSVI